MCRVGISYLNVPNYYSVAIAIEHVFPLRVTIEDHGLSSLSVRERTEHILCTKKQHKNKLVADTCGQSNSLVT